MIPVTKTLRTPAELNAAGLVPTTALGALEEVAARYAIAISPASAALIDRADPHDPIARQFLPDAAELDEHPDERADPIGDDAHTPIDGIVHRYPDRVLLKLVHVCPVYCRFCFRRAVVGPHGRPSLTAAQIAGAMGYIRSHPEVWEVILTGGDPLMLSARRLREVIRTLAAIEHVKVVRLHTRVPAVTPERVTRELVLALKAKGVATYVVLHANHARELTAEVRTACARFIDAGIPMLSQTVLLRGVNDDAATLGALMRALVETRVKPYYLHHGDLAPGTAHFRTSLADGQALMRHLRGRYSGLCQPTYVLDIPGGAGKVPAGPAYVAGVEDGSLRCMVEDIDARRHPYPPEAE